MPASETKLLPCPFCGGEDLTVYSRENVGSWVACVSCGLETPTETGTTPDEATKYWNTRAQKGQSDPDAWMREDGSAATVNPMTAAAWKSQGGKAVPLYAALAAALLGQVVVPRPLSEYHEDMGPMLWWCWEPPKPFEQISERVVSSAHSGQWLGEAPYCGTPNDLGHGAIVQVRTSSDQKEHQLPNMRIDVGGWPGYHTHFTPIITPPQPSEYNGPDTKGGER